jgi:hypothetical protein
VLDRNLVAEFDEFRRVPLASTSTGGGRIVDVLSEPAIKRITQDMSQRR